MADRAAAWRPRDLHEAYLPFLQGEGLANYRTDAAFLAGPEEAWDDNPQMAILRWVGLFGDRSVTWEDLDWLRSVTDLPIVVKGVVHPDDARRAVDAGVEGIIVSNHGGRQVDNAIGALTMLPEVVEAVDGAPVLFDSGIRPGADVFTAVCLGARAVLVGRCRGCPDDPRVGGPADASGQPACWPCGRGPRRRWTP